MGNTVHADALPVSISGPTLTGKVNLLDLLHQAYGDQADSIQSVRIGYWDASYLANIKGADGKTTVPFSYWSTNDHSVTTVLNKGNDIGGSHFGSDGKGHFSPITVDAAHFKDIQIQIGNNIMPNVGIQVAESSVNGTTVWHDLSITTVPQQLTTHGASDHGPTAADIVSTAEFFANVEGGVVNYNDCASIAADIAASAGATFDPATQDLDPTKNEEGGFWRIAYREDPGAVDGWETKVQAGDIVRMGWKDNADGTPGGYHTTTVIAGLNADGKHPGMIQVVDNGYTDPGTHAQHLIGEHWVGYDADTKKGTVTVYRLTTDDKYLIDQSTDGHGNTILGTKFNDLIKGGDGADVLTGGAGNDELHGGNNSDTLVGGAGNDTLDGGVGNDTMRGGDGDDTYIVSSQWDIVDDTFSIHGRRHDAGGIDEVQTILANYSLEAGAFLHGDIENLTFTGAGNFTGTGNALANTITGGDGEDHLFGADGADDLWGGKGSDTLDGGTGADIMHGGKGDDTYVVDSRDDMVSELSFQRLTPTSRLPSALDSGGIDTVRTSLSSYSLNTAENSHIKGTVENLTFIGTGNFTGTGNAKDNVIQGGLGDDVLSGGGGKDTLHAYDGNDRLDGGTDADTMMGGRGNDTYVVDNVGDVVSELGPASVMHLPFGQDIQIPGDMGGIDTIETTLQTFALNDASSNSTLAWIENLTFTGHGDFTGHGNSLANDIRGGDNNDHLFGMDGADRLFGGNGADTLDGGTGADWMAGGAGNDVYYVDSLADTVTEQEIVTDAKTGHLVRHDAGGTDEIRTALSSFSLDHAAGNIENLTYNGTGSFEGHGNGLDNVITGGHGTDKLLGGEGKDTLNGGAGADHLTGGTGADKFVFALGDNGVTAGTADHITDFEKGDALDVSTFVATHATIEATRNFHGSIAEALSFANAQLAAGHNVAGSAMLADSSSHNVYVFMDQNGDHKFESAVILDHADSHMSEIHTEIANHQLFI